MASALRGHPVISQVLANRPPADPRPFAQFAEDCQSRLTATVVRVQRLAPRILEIVIHAPMAARNFQPGQFFRLQNFESPPASSKSPSGPISSQRSPATAIEPLALTGARVICPATGHDGVATILLKDRKVAGIGHAEPPSDATVIDARGLVVAPGIIDAGVFKADTAAANAGGGPAAAVAWRYRRWIEHISVTVQAALYYSHCRLSALCVTPDEG
jgi:hypothetical protein